MEIFSNVFAVELGDDKIISLGGFDGVRLELFLFY